jgi:rhodanese-related sulfurtransferase
LSSHPILIGDTLEQLSEARVRLARVGIEDVHGYLQGGVEAWRQAGLPLAELRQVAVQTLNDWQRDGHVRILDVRRESEWQAAHLADAFWIPLDKLPVTTLAADRDALIAVHCKGGYRSMIACSLLQRAGFHNVVNVTGGFDAWQQAELPVIGEQPVRA